ncbi:MAG: hypothetical protein R3320_10145 [Nitriliruptorales bacterium]|nr:hypothetical protein [Nitriliruptorales bacterium]
MAELHIALEEGFDDDVVVVHVDDDEVFRGEDVTTRYQIGLAELVDLTLGSGEHDIEVHVATRGLDGTFRVVVADELWFGLSISEDGRFRERISEETFRYA